MNWMVAAAWAPAVITLAAVIFSFGENRQQFRDHGRRLDVHDERLDASDSLLARHAEELAEQRGFIRGIEASDKISK